jgi:hypothetical protein
VYQIDDILYIGSGLIDVRISANDGCKYFLILKEKEFELITDDQLDAKIMSKLISKDPPEYRMKSKMETIKASINAKKVSNDSKG